MARRRRAPEHEVPPELIAFDPAEWPGQRVRDRFRAWERARRDYMHAFPGRISWALAGPGAQYGDFLDCMRHELAVARDLQARGILEPRRDGEPREAW